MAISLSEWLRYKYFISKKETDKLPEIIKILPTGLDVASLKTALPDMGDNPMG